MLNQKTGRQNIDTEFYGPDYEHVINFGAVAGNSIPAKIVPEYDRSGLFHASGNFAELRGNAVIRNDEMYEYLRLGVSSQSAMAFKAMGYETPESLMQSPRTSALLPDHLAFDGVVPIHFIDACEEVGISAMRCQYAVRRGALDSHLDGVLNIHELVHVMHAYVATSKRLKSGSQTQLTGADYIIDGTIPLSCVENGAITTSTLAALGAVFSENVGNPSVEAARRDPELFSRFERALMLSNSHETVRRVIKAVDTYGTKVLDLECPLAAIMSISDDDGTHEVGYETVAYMEAMNAADSDLYRRGYVSEIGYHKGANAPVITFGEYEMLKRSGMTPEQAAGIVLDGKMNPSLAIEIYSNEIAAPLWAGAL